MFNQKFMRLAINVAKKGIDQGQTPFGACVVKNNKVIACEHNQVWQKYDSTAHAEINAIRAAGKKLKTIDLSGGVIYSTTEPCPMCFSAIHWAKIDRIYYGASIADAEKAGFSELSISNIKMKKEGKSKVKIIGEVLLAENQELWNYWKKVGNRAVY